MNLDTMNNYTNNISSRNVNRSVDSIENNEQSGHHISTNIRNAIIAKDSVCLASNLIDLMGYDAQNNPPTLEAAGLLTRACSRMTSLSRKVKQQRVNFLLNQTTDHLYFGSHYVTKDSVVDIISFLQAKEKFQLSSLNRSWRHLVNSSLIWHSLDPMPVSGFPKISDMKVFLNQNKKKFSQCKLLQVPRVKTSAGLFKDLFAAIPQLCSISLHHASGTGSLQHLVHGCLQPKKLLQLSFGLFTKVTPSDVVTALNHFGKYIESVQSFYLCTFNDYNFISHSKFTSIRS